MPTDRLYYADSRLLRFEAHVLQRGELDGRPTLVLDRTAFYPTSGGQPHDTGRLGGVPAVDVLERGDDVLHVLGGPAPAAAALTGEVDASRRLDHAQQHTGQHILSQAFSRACGLATVSFHMSPLSPEPTPGQPPESSPAGDEGSTVDLARQGSPGAPLTADEVARAEELANRIVLEDRPVRAHLVDPADLGRFALRRPTAREGPVRVVEVEGFDASACGGTHCARTGEVGPIKVRRWERRGAETRVEFVCGWRALRDYAWKHELVRGLAEGFRVRGRDVAAAVQRARDELAAARDELAELRGRLQSYEAAELLAGAARATLGGREVRVVVRALAAGTPDELKRLAQRLTLVSTSIGGDQAPGVVALLGLRAGSRLHLIFAQSPGLPLDVAALLRTAAARLGGRGGGTRDLAQGGAPDASLADLEAALTQAALSVGGD